MEAESGATATANWRAHATRQTRAAAHRKARLAAALGLEVFEPTRVALAEGRLLVDQAQVIIAAVEALPADLDDRIRADAQATLVGYAEDHDAQRCGSSGTGSWRWSPRRSARPTRPGSSNGRSGRPRRPRPSGCDEDGHGKAYGKFTVPSHVAAQLRKLLLAYAAPKHRAAVDGLAPEPGRPSPQRMGQAFCELSWATPPTTPRTPAGCPRPWR